MRRRVGQVLAVVVAGLALGAGLAVAGDGGSKDPAGDVHAKGLTPAQKAAVDLVAVRVTGDPEIGVFVTATFRGDLEHAMGRGSLSHAAAALILRPRSRAATTAGLVTSGPGSGKLQRHTRSRTVGSIRRGKRLTFFVLGPGWAQIRSAAVETVPNGVPLKAAFAAADGVPAIGDVAWQRFLKRSPYDGSIVVSRPRGLTCPQLRDLLGQVDDSLADPDLIDDVRAALTQFRAKVVRRLRIKCPAPPVPTEGATFAWSRFSSNEVAGSGRFTGPAHTFSSVRIVLPDQYSITRQLCPIELPNATISGNTIDCGGGTLQTGHTFTLNLQTSPPPPLNMGGKLFASVGSGQTFGPFTITGP